MDEIGGVVEKLTEELQEKDRRIRELQDSLTERDQQENTHRLEVARLARAFRGARIRAWFWSVETRLSRYLPIGGDIHDFHGEPAKEGLLSEDLLLQRVHPEDRERLALTWDEAYEDHLAYDIVYRVVAENGIIRFQHETAAPEFDQAGCYLGHAGITQDISQQKLAEEELKLIANRLTEAERIASIGHWKWDEEGFRLVSCSEQAAAIFGVSAEEFLVSSGTHEAYMRFVFPDDRKVFDQALRAFYHRFREDPENAKPLEVEYRIVRADGAIRHIREQAGTTVDDQGLFSRSVGTVQDITDLRQAEEKVRARDAWLAGVLENAPIEIVLKDLEGRFLAISRNVGEILGYSEAEMIGGTSLDFLPTHIAEAYMAADRQVMESGEPLQQEVREDVDGVVRYSLSAKFPLKNAEGKVTGVCSLTSDITEIRQAEELLRQAQKMEAVGQLTGGVAHDFNNLLAIIQGNAELLPKDAGGESEMTQAIIRSAKRGAELTHRLLAFSRQQSLLPQTIDLAELVAGMSGLLARTLGETISIETAVEPGLWPATADPGQVENALLNLAINARDAMPGGGKLTIECQNIHLDEAYVARNREAMAGDYVVLAVSDDGTGMSTEVQAQAFEPFFTTKEVGKGSGLGLSMVYGFVKQSGGQVTIYSEEGRGTTVKLYLARAEGASRPEEARQSTGNSKGRGESILVIEDDDDVRALASAMLGRMGYRAITAADATGARSVLESGEKVDLVLSDVVLPGGMSGPEFAEELRRDYPNLAVIFMSGYPAEAAMRNGFLGSDRVLLNKPFQMEQLAKAVQEALRLSMH